MSTETMMSAEARTDKRTESGRAARGALLTVAGLFALLTVLPALPLLAAGGDNDSPYNMPDRCGSCSGSNSHGGGGGSRAGDVVVYLAPGAQLTAATLRDTAARVDLERLGQITLAGSGGASTMHSADATRLHIPAGGQVNLQRNGLSGSLQGGAFVIESRWRIMLRPSSASDASGERGRKLAFLLIGEPGSNGRALASVDYITGLPLGNGGINLTGLAGELATRYELDGKAALVVLVNAASGSAGSPGRINVEAFSDFRIGSAPAIRIRIRDL